MSGVPQGTVIGPLLFLIYIADIGDNIEAKIKVYVDDTKLKRAIKSESDIESLQNYLETMYSWADSNNMIFNESKFQVKRYGKNHDIKDDTLYFTDKMDNIIERFDKVKYLGVILNDEGNFKDHIEKALRKARKKLGWILRSFKSRNKWFMKHLFKTLVIPHIDYWSQL